MGLGHRDWSFVANILGTGWEVDGDEPLKLSDVKGLISSWRVRRRRQQGDKDFKASEQQIQSSISEKCSFKTPQTERHCLFFQLPASTRKLGKSFFFFLMGKS